jgi:hypothetical protein
MAVVERERVAGNLEFDVVVDGKYEKRVSRGVLLEDNIIGCSVYITGSDVTIYNAMIALERYLDKNDLREEYEAYRTLIETDLEDEEELEKTLDVLFKE